jgi:hypothetical protein
MIDELQRLLVPLAAFGLLSGCVSTEPRPQEVIYPPANVLAATPQSPTTRRIAANGASGFILPDGTTVAADPSGGFRLPNGAYVTPDKTGGITLPNGSRCAADGAGGYICP